MTTPNIRSASLDWSSPVTNTGTTINHSAGTDDDKYKVVVKLLDSDGDVVDEKSSRWDIVKT